MSLLFLNIASVLHHDQLFWSHGASKMGSGVLNTLYIATRYALYLGLLSFFGKTSQMRWSKKDTRNVWSKNGADKAIYTSILGINSSGLEVEILNLK